MSRISFSSRCSIILASIRSLNAEAIAVNVPEMVLVAVALIAVVIGEGGSGGALGIGVADRLLILENAYYSVISPEGCAAILWKDQTAVAQAAESLKIRANDLLEGVKKMYFTER